MSYDSYAAAKHDLMLRYDHFVAVNSGSLGGAAIPFARLPEEVQHRMTLEHLRGEGTFAT